MSMLVSCVCLTTNPRRERYLPDALRSFRQQSYQAKELIVVNDGAPLRSNAQDVTVVNLPDIGRRWRIGEKRNVGVRTARGEFIATWDDDDVSMPERLSLEAEASKMFRADYVLADAMYIGDDKMRLVGRCDRGLARPVMASALIRRSAVVAAGGYNPIDYLEDYALMERVRFLVRGVVVTLRNCDWYVMRRHDANITNSMGESNCEYGLCAAKDRYVAEAQRRLDALLAGPGAKDVTP